MKKQQDLGGSEDNTESLNKAQEMILACDQLFNPDERGGGAAAARVAAMRELRERMDAITAADLGLAPERQGRGIEYTELVDGLHFTACVFSLAAGARLPMHDHPNMTVFSRVLWGDLEVQSYDKAPFASSPDTGLGGLAGLLGRASIFSPFPVTPVLEREVWTAAAGTQTTLPDHGNIHEFRALTPCCVLDVLGPPYDAAQRRRCTYYEVERRRDGSSWARPIRCPDDYTTRTVPYAGPPLVSAPAGGRPGRAG